MIDHHFVDIPEGTLPETVIRLGPVVAPIKVFLKKGMLREENGRFIKTHDKHITSSIPPSKSNPFSLKNLQVKGFKVVPGKTEKDDLVMVLPGSYCSITDALRNGLLNETTQPI